MPVDASIYGQIQQQKPINSLANYADALAIQQGVQSNQINALKMDKAQREMQDENALRDQVKGFGADTAANYNALLKTGNLKAAQDYQKANLDQSKIKVDVEAAQLKAAYDKNNIILNAISSAKDPNSYAQSLANLQSQGIDTSKIPTAYDPTYIANSGRMALTTKERLEQAAKDRQIDISAAAHQETARHNKVSEGISAGGLAVEQGNLSLRRQEAQQKNQPGSLKLTEDQAKASGWLAQADNAYKNMLSVLKEDPSAANPGFGDLVGSGVLPGSKAVGNMLTGAARQKFNQASSSIGEAVLRAATGAGVTQQEAEQKVRELTPQIGDSPQVKAQKMASIPVYLQSLRVRSGPAGANYQIPSGNAIGPDSSAIDAEIARRKGKK